MKEFTVLTINPGSSSTKMGVVKGDKVIVNREVDHHKEDLQSVKLLQIRNQSVWQ